MINVASLRAALIATLFSFPAFAGPTPPPGVKQSGAVVNGDCVKWLGNLTIADTGAACGGGGIAIGNAISGSAPFDVLFVDGSGKLGQSPSFTFNATTFDVGRGNADINLDSTAGLFLRDPAGVIGLTLGGPAGHYLYDTAGLTSLNFGGRMLLNATNVSSLSWSSAGSNPLVTIGDTAVAFNKTLVTVDDAGKAVTVVDDTQFAVTNSANRAFISAVIGLRLVSIGDLGGAGLNTKIVVNDVSRLVTITNVPTFNNDATAISGGLTSGQLYKNTTVGITALNIVP